LPPEYFEGLASEELRVRYVRGAPRHEYHRTYRQNEPFDCLIYALALAKVIDPSKINQQPAPKLSDAEIAAMVAKLNGG
jgi:phage terminase large subunit GpA-like protein